MSGTSAYTDTYVYSPSGAPLELIRQTASAGPCGNTTCRYWYELDGQGSVVALTDSSGHVVDSYSYDAWGTPLSVSEQVPQRLRYRGYWYDAELGTYWLSVRQYDPVLKRFVQPDPSHQEGFASYVYADSDPVDNADPSGTLPGNTNCGPDLIYCGGLPGGEYDYPPDPQPGDPCYYDINCYYDGTVTADDIAQIEQANADFLAYGLAQASVGTVLSGASDGTDAAAALSCDAGCVQNATLPSQSLLHTVAATGPVEGGDEAGGGCCLPGAGPGEEGIGDFVAGQDWEYWWDTSEGPVGLYAEVVVDGDIVILDNVAIYGVGEEDMTGILRDVMVAKSDLARMARDQGYNYLEIRGIRAANSSSENPGREVDIIIDTNTGKLVKFV